MQRQELTSLLSGLYEPQKFRDYAPNGLQVEGKQDIVKIVTGVTASEALIDRAIAEKADAIIVHHGYFWKGESEVITGMKYRRIAKLIRNDINLYGYHLPMDAHPQLGNNVQLALALGLEGLAPLESGKELDESIGVVGSLPGSVATMDFIEKVATVVDRQVLAEVVIPTVQRVALCTGGAQGYIHKAIAIGADLFITGEVSEQTIHVAREESISFCAAGHHATECFGPRALAEYLNRLEGIDALFVDVPNPA
ncbi:Nif3-like dinuclear metal center hexameric protein [Maribrevibacterium harenarium]|uniref:GTP cyclohydrolase 1 type 2 homolog n=1 Tax=Maribrevibacterium harenarium TaxID=2589817 RepID=A0A501WRF8_9GAMM|nr:Nif3-like dinuclear metal center hexameric protein [Maribrevibacterium harenarium]TPE52343.1 Nif3-like dinuclear metal center hexameric protein [Maribrevibacterium harenarium]